eukprot:gene31709-41158_t
MFPEFQFWSIREESLEKDIANCATQLSVGSKYIIKPSRGFYGVGVKSIHVQFGSDHIGQLKEAILESREDIAKRGTAFFPHEVLNGENIIVETMLDGPEVAVDMFFNGKATIVHVYHHPSLQGNAGSNALYYSSPQLMAIVAPKARVFLEKISSLIDGLGGTALHAEFILTGGASKSFISFGDDACSWDADDGTDPDVESWRNGILVPVEINPCRFGSYGLPDMADPNYFPVGQILSFVVASNSTSEDTVDMSPAYHTLCHSFPGKLHHCMKVQWRTLPFFAILTLGQTPSQLKKLISFLGSIIWDDFWVKFEDEKKVLVIEKLTLKDIKLLFYGDIAAIKIRKYVNPEVVSKIMEFVAKMSLTDYGHETYSPDSGNIMVESYGVKRLREGVPLNSLYNILGTPPERRSPEDLAKVIDYVEMGKRCQTQLAEVCSPQLSPAEVCLQDLNALWPTGAQIACFKDGSSDGLLPSWIGQIRQTMNSTSSEAAIKLERNLHVDCLKPEVMKLDAQLSFNCYLEAPPAGGRIIVSTASRVSPEKISIGSANCVIALDDDDAAAAAAEPVKKIFIPIEAGCAIFINTWVYHGVESFETGERCSVQSFIGLPAEELEMPIIMWN